MSEEIGLKQMERRVFRAATQDGLWDIMLGIVALMFVVAPYLSPSLGDFWSSAIFIPVWAVAWLAIRIVRKYILAPRLGAVKFGADRKRRLKKFSTIMLVINLIAFAGGIWAALTFDSSSGFGSLIWFGILCITGSSLAGYFLDFRRLYLYGLMFALAPVIGEVIWNRWQVPHHGFPVTFGVTSAIMIIIGLTVFIGLLRRYPRRDIEAARGDV